MSKNKQSSVTELYNKMMQYVPIEYHYLVKEKIPLEQYEAMHKEEFTKAFTNGYKHSSEPLNHDLIDKQYNETFGSNK